MITLAIELIGPVGDFCGSEKEGTGQCVNLQGEDPGFCQEFSVHLETDPEDHYPRRCRKCFAAEIASKS